MLSAGSVSCIVGVCVLLHAAFAVSRYRDTLKLTQEEFQGLPANLLSEILFGTIISLLGGYLLAGDLKPCMISGKPPSMDAFSFRSDFISFNHRSKAVPPKLPALDPTARKATSTT